MRAIGLALLIAAAVVAGAGDAIAETADCRAQLQRQDERCQELAEELASACPSGTNIKETAECRQISSQIASTCTRKPCGPPPRKAKGKGKGKGKAMGKGMGKATSKSMMGETKTKKK